MTQWQTLRYEYNNNNDRKKTLKTQKLTER